MNVTIADSVLSVGRGVPCCLEPGLPVLLTLMLHAGESYPNSSRFGMGCEYRDELKIRDERRSGTI
jgi:hypothetical protein